MLQISEIVEKAEGMFDLFNKHFFPGELTRPATIVMSCWRILDLSIYDEKDTIRI